jgi:hypothetical protein
MHGQQNIKSLSLIPDPNPHPTPSPSLACLPLNLRRFLLFVILYCTYFFLATMLYSQRMKISLFHNTAYCFQLDLQHVSGASGVAVG